MSPQVTGIWLPLSCVALALVGLNGCIVGPWKGRRLSAAVLALSLAGLMALLGLWLWEVRRLPLPMFARWARGPTADCAVALAEFRRREGRYPGDLDELAAGTDWVEPRFGSWELSFLFVLPVPELGGAKVRYYPLPEADGYAVGLCVSGGRGGFPFRLWVFELLTGPDGPAAAHPQADDDWEPERRPDLGRFAVFKLD